MAIIAQAGAGWLIADALSGVVHWWEDRIGKPGDTLIGRQVAAQRAHHNRPADFLRRGFVHRNRGAWAVTGVVSLTWLAVLGPSVVWTFATIGGLLSTVSHSWAHRRGPAWLRALQLIGVIQSPSHHAAHHHGNFDRRYCVLTNWLNPMLDGLGVWNRLERRTVPPLY